MTEPTAWEYLVVTYGSTWSAPKDDAMQAALNQLGQENWEVVSVFTLANESKMRVVAKRPLTTRSRRRRSMPGMEE